MESASSIRRRETIFVVDAERDFDVAQPEILAAVNAYTLELYDHGQMLDMLGLIQYTGEGQIRASIQDITGGGAPDVMASWADLDSCNQKISFAWIAYWRFLNDVPSTPLGGTANLRARSTAGLPGWTDVEEEFYAIAAGMDTTPNGKSDCQECEESALADNTQCSPADPYDDPTADRDYCAWLVSYTVFENFTDVYDISNPSSAPFCHLGNEYEFHVNRFDTSESVATVVSPQYGATMRGGDKDRFYAEAGVNPGDAADMAITELTGAYANPEAVKNIILIAGADPYCLPGSSPNMVTCQSDRDTEAFAATLAAAVLGINVYVGYIGDLAEDTTDLQNMVVGTGTYVESDVPSDLTGFLLDIAREAPVVVTR